MTTRLVPSRKALLSGPGLVALLLSGWCLPGLAATGVDVKCPESEREKNRVVAEAESPRLAIPLLTIDVADHAVDSEADIEAEIVDPPLASPAVNTSSDSDETANDVEDADGAINEAAPTATRLPGVSDTDQPRFRRQMYRTDI